MAYTKKTSQPAANQVSPNDVLEAYLRANKDDHFNFETSVYYKVSTGSLTMDRKLNGGIAPGIHRFVGYNNAGKTSECFEVARNFLTTVPKPRVMYIKAEGRLSPEMIDRLGLSFVTDPQAWDNTNIFVFECNIYETIINLLRVLVKNNPDKYQYCFIFDSTDALVSKKQIDLDVNESKQPASVPTLSKTFLRAMNLAMVKFGHLCLMIGQVTADINLRDAGGPKPIFKPGNFAGGNALMHWPDYIFEYRARILGDIIFDTSSGRMNDPNSKVLGHYSRLVIKKSSNETLFEEIQYPIKHGRIGKSAIWVEKELVDWLIADELVNRNGSWFVLSDTLLMWLKEAKIDLTTVDGEAVGEKIQGENNLLNIIENNPAFVTLCVQKHHSIYTGIK